MKKENNVPRLIRKTMQKHRLLVAGILLSVCGAIVLSLVPPMILAGIIDDLTMQKPVGFWVICAYFGMLALTGLMESAREGLLLVFGQKITHVLRSVLMEKLTRLKADDLNKQEPGAVVSRFVGDVDTVENLFTSGIVSMFADACKIVSILVVIWFQNRGLSIILLVLLPFIFLFTRYVQKNMLASQLQNRKAVSRASGHVPETLHNIRTIHCLSKEGYMEQKYDEYIGESYRAMEKTNFYDAVYSPVILILNAMVVAGVMLLSASGNPKVLTLFGMSAGTAVAVINYISQIFDPVESLGMEIQTIQSAVAGIRRIDEFLSMEELPELREDERVEQQNVANVEDGFKIKELAGKPKNSVPKEGMQETFVEFHDVTFGYDEKNILNHLSFQVNRGEQVTLMGRTGAGKSTILKLLLGLYEPKEGKVSIQGVDATKIREEERRRLFGYVEQSFHMVPGTVRDQITLYDSSISEQEVKNVAELTGLAETIEALPEGYDTICTPELFSQGQWQLLSIARAAAARPQLLLLDEITANLDAETERLVLQALKKVSKERTVISISHRTSAEMGRVISVISV